MDDLRLDNTTFVNLNDLNATVGSYQTAENSAPLVRRVIPADPNAFLNLRPVEVKLACGCVCMLDHLHWCIKCQVEDEDEPYRILISL